MNEWRWRRWDERLGGGVKGHNRWAEEGQAQRAKRRGDVEGDELEGHVGPLKKLKVPLLSGCVGVEKKLIKNAKKLLY